MMPLQQLQITTNSAQKMSSSMSFRYSPTLLYFTLPSRFLRPVPNKPCASRSITQPVSA